MAKQDTFRSFLTTAFLVFLLLGCGSSSGVLSTPIENIDTSPLKESELTESEKKTWSHLDFVTDTIPGMSVNKAYSNIIKGKKGKKVIVAVMDSGIDIDHEDLDGVIWTNTNEIPNNGKDDDNNGYVDDIHGWNFVGDGYNEQFEFVRLLATGDQNNPRFLEAETLYRQKFQRYTELKTQYEDILPEVISADKTLTAYFGKPNYTKKEVLSIKTEDETLVKARQYAQLTYLNDFNFVSEFIEGLNKSLKSINEHLNIHLDKNLKGRKTGDDPNDLNDKPGYGNNNPRPSTEDESHGTHIAGIIAAERNNGKGINGVANNVEIMAIRSTPNGDEYDKDVALAIRYAADNGAKIINMSFGKSFSPHSNWVRDAITYASEKDVLIVHSSGNDGANIDVAKSYPNDAIGTGPEISDNFIKVGALIPRYGANMIAEYSNYGNSNVDVFAPGSEVYSAIPDNAYDFRNGTSMAAPNVSGVAALIRSQYPDLSASQVKQILMDSGLPITARLSVGDGGDIKTLSEISKSGKIVNAYNALILASHFLMSN